MLTAPMHAAWLCRSGGRTLLTESRLPVSTTNHRTNQLATMAVATYRGRISQHRTLSDQSRAVLKLDQGSVQSLPLSERCVFQ